MALNFNVTTPVFVSLSTPESAHNPAQTAEKQPEPAPTGKATLPNYAALRAAQDRRQILGSQKKRDSGLPGESCDPNGLSDPRSLSAYLKCVTEGIPDLISSAVVEATSKAGVPDLISSAVEAATKGLPVPTETSTSVSKRPTGAQVSRTTAGFSGHPGATAAGTPTTLATTTVTVTATPTSVSNPLSTSHRSGAEGSPGITSYVALAAVFAHYLAQRRQGRQI